MVYADAFYRVGEMRGPENDPSKLLRVYAELVVSCDFNHARTDDFLSRSPQGNLMTGMILAISKPGTLCCGLRQRLRRWKKRGTA